MKQQGRNQQIGAFGEAAAAKHYEQTGYQLVSRNERTPCGELDVIVKNSTDLVFCEVKTRRDERFGAPAEAVDKLKRQHILAAAQYYLLDHPTRLQPRFDVCAVFYRICDGLPEAIRVEVIENAFGEQDDAIL